MAESVDCSDFCRLCLVKEQVNTPIFEELGDLQQIYIKITACLPIKVSLEDPLPKRICDECSYKLDQQYNFWNTSINAEKQLRQWLGLPEEPPTKSENVSGKIKREKDNYESPSKRPRRNARRKAAQHVRQAAAAAIAASDSGPGEDMDLDAFTKEENDSDNDFHDNNESMEDSTYANVGLDSEEHGEAGPSGLQKGAVTSTNSGTDAGGPGEYSSIKKEQISDYEDEDYNFQIKTEKILNFEDILIGGGNVLKIEMDDNKSRKCDICNEIFRNNRDLRKHKFNVHKKGTKDNLNFTCDVCGNSYTTKGYLNQHKKRHISNGFKCKDCSEGFSTLNDLISHKNTTHPPFCNICNKHFPNDNTYKNHRRVVHDAKINHSVLTCQKCGKCYKTSTEYNRHVKSHEGFTCHQCGKMFRYAEPLKYHMYTHTGEKPFSCKICEKKFRKRNTLTEHLRTHTKERPFICSVCGKGFTQRSPLKLHMRSHTGERPYKCPICSQGFISKNYLKIHMKSSHNITDVQLSVQTTASFSN